MAQGRLPRNDGSLTGISHRRARRGRRDCWIAYCGFGSGGFQISHFIFEIGYGPSPLGGGCQQELNDGGFSWTRESRDVHCTGERSGVGKKKPLHCAGAEEEINRRCHDYVQFICFARDVKGLGKFFLILPADSPY